MRTWRAFARLLALLLLLQWSATPGQCETLRAQAPANPAMGHPAHAGHSGAGHRGRHNHPAQQPAHQIPSACSVCQGLAHAGLLPVPPLPLPGIAAWAAPHTPSLARAAPARPRGPVQPRAPPTLS